MLNLDSIPELFPCHYLPGGLIWQGNLGKKGNSYRWSEIKLDLRSENRARSFKEEVNLPLEYTGYCDLKCKYRCHHEIRRRHK